MNKGLLIRGGVIVGLAALAAFAAYPPKDKLNLGLDLQGGIHLVLKVETQDAVRAETDKEMEVLRREIADGGVTSVAPSRTSDTSFDVTGVPVANVAQRATGLRRLINWDRARVKAAQQRTGSARARRRQD